MKRSLFKAFVLNYSVILDIVEHFSLNVKKKVGELPKNYSIVNEKAMVLHV